MKKPDQTSSSCGNDDDTDMPSVAADPACSGSTVVFAGDPSQVSAGFALALRLMGLDAPMPEPRDPPEQDE
jgi:hypothetical protein